MKYSSQHEPRVPEVKGASPKPQETLSDLTSEEWIDYLAVLARGNDVKTFEEAYLCLITEEREKFGEQLDSMKNQLFLQLREEKLLDNVHINCKVMELLYEDINAFKDQHPEPSAPAPIFYPGPDLF